MVRVKYQGSALMGFHIILLYRRHQGKEVVKGHVPGPSGSLCCLILAQEISSN